jgi:hypothetical protein
MSVLDQVRALEQQVLQRLRELRPLIDEYRDLEKVAERLGLKRDDDAAEAAAAEPAARKPRATRTVSARPAKRTPAPKARAKAATAATAPPAVPGPVGTPKTKPAAASPPKRATARSAGSSARPSARKRPAVAPGQRQQDVLRLVRERPGITVAELGAELEVDPTGLYGVVRRLQAKGEITKDGMQLRPADAASDTAAPADLEPAGRAPADAQPGSAEPPASGS